MASNHTTNYQLCQWEATDKVLRTDFNEDNQKIDAALKDNADAISAEAAARAAALSSLSQTVSGKAEASAVPQTASGTYTGTGECGSAHPNSITFPFQPKLVAITMDAENGQALGTVLIRGQQNSGGIGTNSSSAHGMRLSLIWAENTLSWYTTTTYANEQLNQQGAVYHYWAIG